MNLGNKILELRKKANMSQEQLAEKMCVTRQTISKWELSETTPDIKEAKKLSVIFKISLDDLTDNDVKNIIVEKVSNTEKLAGIIIKVLKAIGILFLIMLVIDIIIFLLFTFVKKQPTSSITKSATISCTIEDNNYLISIGSDGYFNCSNCNKKMQVYLNDITDWANIETSTKNIKKYFIDNGGNCDNN